MRTRTLLFVTSSVRNLHFSPKFSRRYLSTMSSSLNDSASSAELNPLLASEWASPLGLPPFGRVQPAHFAPAFEAAQRAHLEEVAAIASNTEPPTFENTALALDRAGAALSRLSAVFSNLCSSCSSPALQEVEAALAGPLAAHDSRVTFTPGLFERLDALHAAALRAQAAPSQAGAGAETGEDAGAEAAPKSPRLSLSPVELRLVERIHLDFVRAGAKFDADAKLKCAHSGHPPTPRPLPTPRPFPAAAQASLILCACRWAPFSSSAVALTPVVSERCSRYAALTERLAVLETTFTQTVTLDESEVLECSRSLSLPS